jgi:hypothetical protein
VTDNYSYEEEMVNIEGMLCMYVFMEMEHDWVLGFWDNYEL